MVGDPARLRELEIFAAVVAEESFSAAARASGLTPSAVSKAVARLERRLGVRLVARTTRGLTLTAEGRDFHLRAVSILCALEEAEREATTGGRPIGTVTIATSASYGHHTLYPALRPLLAEHPDLHVVVLQNDAVVALLDAEADIAVRAGEMPPSAMLVRSLGHGPRLVVGSPAYLAARGVPRTPDDLADHDLIDFTYQRHKPTWPYRPESGPPGVRIRASDGEGVRHMALAGLGLARLTEFVVRADLAAGRLVSVLDDAGPPETEPFHAVWLKSGGPLPARIRLVLDHLAAHGRIDPPSH
ncbi:LysR family transcriptional regulator [Acuticoccus sediminis]|uniref:LysR family transcriptional regulator n=1 Tax=Acuticoccus sediminis TaxID=2184697 RepID=UPI001CFD3748|nr:LysR family transcriptional regulator [Acuticoccus sediminis]